MEVMSHTIPPSSTLNANAPMFVPSAYRHVEDFSDQWWDLVQSTPWFRDYWLQECFTDPQINNDLPHLLSDLCDPLFPDDIRSPKEQEKKQAGKELIPLGMFKWRKSRAVGETPRLYEKAPKIINVKVSPGPIQ